MSLLVSLLAAVVVFIAGWAVIKRYPTVIVLFAAGLIMIGLAILFGADSILPKNAKTTGLIWFDAIDIIRLAAIKQVAGIGMIINGCRWFCKIYGNHRRFWCACTCMYLSAESSS